ncbi:MAG: TetR/AcrR family transcriptional regulator [Actinomycetota bacterium]|nr:TetR/AcrR family transcriptional regulator [Actinomycetota bacterium]
MNRKADFLSRESVRGEGGRERVMKAAYDLFSRRGIHAVGVDTIISAAQVAKMTLYRHFASKDQLVLAFLQRREEVWTEEWLKTQVKARAATPAARLLAIFDIFGEWFALPDFEGCTFLNVMLEFDDADHPVRRASVRHLANIRSFIRDLAAALGIEDPEAFSRQWHILMKGAIVAAGEGDIDAAARARELGVLLLAHHGIRGD